MTGKKTGSLLVLGSLMLMEYLCTGNGLSILPSEQARIAWYSPLSWSNLTLLSFDRYLRPLPYPSCRYALLMSVLLTMILMIVTDVLIRFSEKPGERGFAIKWDD